MGMFDYVRVSGETFKCSEGHDLCGEEFQTKDLGCTMGRAVIEEDGSLKMEDGGWGHGAFASPFFGEVEIYASCRQCPAFVQAKTMNLCDRDVAFKVHVVADGIEKVARLGGSLAEWLASERAEKWMVGAAGPMTYEQANAIHCRARGVR